MGRNKGDELAREARVSPSPSKHAGFGSEGRERHVHVLLFLLVPFLDIARFESVWFHDCFGDTKLQILKQELVNVSAKSAYGHRCFL